MAAFIAAQRTEYQIPCAVSCRALGVSQAWFYKWAAGTLPPRAARRGRLKAEVGRLFGLHGGKRGSPVITLDLQDAGWTVAYYGRPAIAPDGPCTARRTPRSGRQPRLRQLPDWVSCPSRGSPVAVRRQ
jgi:putative transposase